MKAKGSYRANKVCGGEMGGRMDGDYSYGPPLG